MSKKIIIVIPCFNESRRLKESFFEPFLERPDLSLLMVDDGSTDGTAAWLKAWTANHRGKTDVLTLDRNVGKGEAVRQGVLQVLQREPAWVGYIDSDGATPAGECLRLSNHSQESPEMIMAVFGSRIKRLGADIQRSRWRHYGGRVFATAASAILSLPVYDTQCGVKFFRNTEAVRRAFANPFHSRWMFDVELIGRLAAEARAAGKRPEEVLLEIPLCAWHDMQESKRRPWDYARAGWDLVRIWTSLTRTSSRKGPR